MSSPIHSRRSGAEDRVTVGGDELTFRLTGDQSAGALVACEVRMAAGGGPPMLHRHAPFELYRVERGELVFYVEGERGSVARSVAGPGACVAIPGGREHTIRNESGDEAQAFVVFAPGAGMERFFRAAGALAARGTEEVLALAADHGVEMTRPLSAIA
jgi:oxalate decarboxylase/phosphoglucose isomerase-like protein (cupin superfamily)